MVPREYLGSEYMKVNFFLAQMTSFEVVKNSPLTIFFHKVPLAPSKWLSRWIKMDKWDYFHFCIQDFFFLFSISVLFDFLNMKALSENAHLLLIIQMQNQAV